MLRRMMMLCAVQVLVFANGCGPRTVLVPESSPVRIGPNVKGRVYVREGNEWTLSSNCVEIPEGFYLVPPSYVDE